MVNLPQFCQFLLRRVFDLVSVDSAVPGGETKKMSNPVGRFEKHICFIEPAALFRAHENSSRRNTSAGCSKKKMSASVRGHIGRPMMPAQQGRKRRNDVS